MTTPHISAEPGDFAPLVLMPGDPRRARLIAQTFFTSPRLVTEVRGIEGYTGTVNGTEVSVLASGMGMPSMSIYATELIRFYGAKRIVRVGTAGGMAPEVQLGELVIASAAHTDSSMAAFRVPGVHFSHAPAFSLLERAVSTAREQGIAHRVGPIFSSDTFYSDRPEQTAALAAHGTLAVEMEAAALYGIAAAEGVEALAVCNVTDHLLREEAMSSEERETRFEPMVEVALGALLS
ncbi:purine-nucleoside phosphorylase [Galactobacter valiniphilus]|uniref:Uridine phosphorylase n=1 Tax=Galactobacter valiniphilus TaxID=2676122 RepID=A0A399JFI7_9MICC|nr:purine-nucleoside phosphorylase [Galactobacter valiniphilus]RII42902.1 purine-nucleoside phosphorylase [Galactobacter valiniphilus]